MDLMLKSSPNVNPAHTERVDPRQQGLCVILLWFVYLHFGTRMALFIPFKKLLTIQTQTLAGKTEEGHFSCEASDV